MSPRKFDGHAPLSTHGLWLTAARMRHVRSGLTSAHNPPFTGLTQEADRLTREVESVDKSIDGLVYELYGLTEEEIRIVEG